MYTTVDPLPNPDVPHERLPEATGSFEETRCFRKVPNQVTQCGYVTVPEAPGSKETIKLAVARVFTNSAAPKEEPIVYLDGGPGAPSVTNIDFLYPAFSRIAPDRDFIFVDQRGIGESKPNLGCSEGGDVFDALDRCYARLEKESDLDAYNTINNATDFELIRRAFGYKQWNLYGISYGTHLGLTIMRDYPDGVRAAALDSVVPLQVDILGEVGRNGYSAFLRVFEACQEDTSCSERYSDPLRQLLDLTEMLNEEPGGVNKDITGDLFVRLVFNLIYSPRGVEIIPFIVNEASNGNFSYFEDLEAAVARTGFSFGMHLSLHCAEEIPFSSPEAVAAYDAEVPEVLRPALTGGDYFSYCEHWPVAKAGKGENEAASSDVPSLLFGGHFDPITPPQYAEKAAETLSNSQYFYMAGESHGASLGACGVSLLKDFFFDPQKELVDCSESEPGLDFASLRSPNERPLTSRIRMKTVAPSQREMDEIKRDLVRRSR